MDRKLILPTIVLAGLIAVDYVVFVRLPRSAPTEGPLLTDTSVLGAQAYILPVLETSYIPILDSSVTQPVLNAKSGIMYDLSSSRVLYAKNSKERLPVASLTKVLTAVVAMDRFRLGDVVAITKDQVRVDKEKQTLYADEQLTVEQLIQMMMIESSNDAAYALAYHAQTQGFDFIQAMNEKAQILAMHDSRFTDPAGLDDAAYSTAEDMLKLVEYSQRYRAIWDATANKELSFTSLDGSHQHKSENTNQLLETLPGITGGKTGYTEVALGCMIMIVRVPEYPSSVISIVIGSRDRFGDTQKLFDWSTRAYRWK